MTTNNGTKEQKLYKNVDTCKILIYFEYTDSYTRL